MGVWFIAVNRIVCDQNNVDDLSKLPDEKVLTHVQRQECFWKYSKGNETWLPSVVALRCMFYNRSIFKNILILMWMDLTYVLGREHWKLRVRCNLERTNFLPFDTMSLRIFVVMTIRYNIRHSQ